MESTFSCCAYCWKHEDSWDSILSFKCGICQKRVHYDCIQSPQPSYLLEDTFFSFKCSACGEGGKEEFNRTNMSWLNAVQLSLYNLHKTSLGMCGFYHWRSHICGFIDRNWTMLFGMDRKKTTLWLGTVAGTLSNGCPPYFESGASVVEQGYWRLAELKPPLPQRDDKLHKGKKASTEEQLVNSELGQRRCRRVKESSLLAAIELKEKRSQTVGVNQLRGTRIKPNKEQTTSTSTSQPEQSETAEPRPVSKRSKKGKGSKAKKSSGAVDKKGDVQESASGDFSASHSVSEPVALSDSHDSASLASSASSSHLYIAEEDSISRKDTPATLGALTGTDSDLDIDIDIDEGVWPEGFYNLPDLRPTSPDLTTIMTTGSTDEGHAGKSPVAGNPPPPLPVVEVKQEPISDEESEGQSEKDIEEDKSDEEEEEEGSDESDSEDDEDDDGEEEYDDYDEEEEIRSRVDSQLIKRGDGRGKEDGRKRKRGRPRKRRRMDDTPPASPPPRLERISLFEEGELLQRLNRQAELGPLKPEVAQLRRKLLCNQTNREYGQPVFDLEREVARLSQKGTANMASQEQDRFVPHLMRKSDQSRETRDLDRFMMPSKKKGSESRQYTCFRQRLVGLKDHELQPIVSPYTTRVLLPFIWRNYNPSRKPLKMRLLEEIQAYPHRKDPSWQPEISPPIDFCYVRPEHIPSVNALCREFFWPGIDMSECLQYPDFSCVVLFRKIVIAFAFMVPDRGYNEAYISFIFTHPEWRGAGIATFMLYHLIQTCMGKDVVLHVSVTNPAVLLYQKFGFKAEEFNVNFYHKYFPLNAQDSLHAYLMRLSR